MAMMAMTSDGRNSVAGHELSQELANALIQMPKVRSDEDSHIYPIKDRTLVVPLQSEDGRESFFLDLHSGRLNLVKATLQNRARQIVILVRLDLGGPPHRNPDGQVIPCPHLHEYREGFGDKWASPVPTTHFQNLVDPWQTLHDFMTYCRIIEPPKFQRGLLP